jgi:hypothetical protein
VASEGAASLLGREAGGSGGRAAPVSVGTQRQCRTHKRDNDIRHCAAHKSAQAMMGLVGRAALVFAEQDMGERRKMWWNTTQDKGYDKTGDRMGHSDSFESVIITAGEWLCSTSSRLSL